MTICLLCTAISAASIFSDADEASSALGFQVTRTADARIVQVSAVDPGSAAERSGLVAGDSVDVGALSPGNRYRILTGVHPHERIPLTITRNGKQRNVLFTAGDAPAWRVDTWVWCFASFWLLAFAGVIGWRRADAPEARILSVLLAVTPAAAGLLPGSWLTPWPLLDLAAGMAGCALSLFGYTLLATYAHVFGRPLSVWRRRLTLVTYVSAIALSLYEIYRLALLWTGKMPWVAQTLAPDWYFPWGALPLVLGLASAIAAIVSANAGERARIAWTTVTLSFLYVGNATAFLVPAFFPDSARGTGLIVAYSLINFGALLAPIGMTYALLSRRVLDIGFALNRVAIFSGVSLIVVGLFVLAEWAIAAWLQSSSHTINLFASAGVALVLGLSIHAVHQRVEHVLDRAFFRKRHEDEQALRRFAHEAAYVTEPTELLSKTITTLQRHADASFATIALHDGNGKYGSVNENDAAIVALRTWHHALDLHDVESRLCGEFAYPMVARGRLIGALLLGPKRSHEAYAPDESQAIEEVAHGVAGALDVLSQQAATSENRTIEELRALRLAISEGFASLSARFERDNDLTQVYCYEAFDSNEARVRSGRENRRLSCPRRSRVAARREQRRASRKHLGERRRAKYEPSQVVRA